MNNTCSNNHTNSAVGVGVGFGVSVISSSAPYAGDDVTGWEELAVSYKRLEFVEIVPQKSFHRLASNTSSWSLFIIFNMKCFVSLAAFSI